MPLITAFLHWIDNGVIFLQIKMPLRQIQICKTHSIPDLSGFIPFSCHSLQFLFAMTMFSVKLKKIKIIKLRSRKDLEVISLFFGHDFFMVSQ